MNWPKAKNILILLFFGINIFLFFAMGRTFPSDTIGREVLENTIQILRIRNVEISCAIPSKIKNLRSFKEEDGSQEGEFSGTSRAVQFKTLSEEDSQETVFNSLKGDLNKLGVDGRNFSFQRAVQWKDCKEYLFSENLEGGVVFHHSVRACVYEDRTTWQAKVGQLIPVDDRIQVLPAHQVLLKNYAYSAKNRKIVYIREGYLQRSAKNKGLVSLYIPVWCIVDSERGVRYFKAGNGEEIIM